MGDTDPREPETVLRLAGITKRFGPLIANDAIDLTLDRGEIVGLLGENGAGKTTLMNILFGHYVADEGTIEVEGKPLPAGSPNAAIAAGVGMVHQHFTLADNLTVLDNIVLGTEPLWRLSPAARARARIRDLGQSFGLAVDPDAIVSSLSVGERQRVEILKALYRKAKILILDEPTAVLTPQESASLFETLKKFVANGLSIIFISYKLQEVLAACSRIYVLRGGKLVAERRAGRSPRELRGTDGGRDRIRAEAQASGPAVLELANIQAWRGSHTLNNVSLTLHAGEIVGIAGVSGNGQSLLADLLNGTLVQSAGEIRLAGSPVGELSARTMVARRVARIPEDRHAEGLIGDMSVTENVVSETYGSAQFNRGGFIDWAAARQFAERIIAGYEVKCPSPEARVRLLSGGNMQKLILGRVMANDPVAVIANQPTRGLDVGAVNAVHERLREARKRGAAILLISEDPTSFIACDRVAKMPGRIIGMIARQFNVNTRPDDGGSRPCGLNRARPARWPCSPAIRRRRSSRPACSRPFSSCCRGHRPSRCSC
jgi:simple sugar transport system ATP-binding protein